MHHHDWQMLVHALSKSNVLKVISRGDTIPWLMATAPILFGLTAANNQFV
jgi:hypothetical protein